MSLRMGRWATLLVLTGPIPWTACDLGSIAQPESQGEQFRFSLTGRVLDGRTLAAEPIAGRVALFQSDGRTRLQPILGEAVITVGPDGRFQQQIEAVFLEPVLVLTATADGPFLPTSLAVRVNGDNVTADLYLSSTLIVGHVDGPDGRPAPVDIWVLRDAGTGNFTPYEVAGGRDFIAPVPPSGLKFGVDTDALGNFAIPVRIPDATFRFVLVVDRNTDRFASKLVDQFITANQTNRIPTIQLETP